MQWKRLITTAATIPLLITTANAAEPETCHEVRIADGGYSDNAAQNGLVAAVLDELGYKTTIRLLAIPIVLETLKSGQMDVFLDAWSPAIDPQTMPYIEKGEVDRLEATLTDAKYTLAVPRYAHEQGLKDFADIHRFQEELDGKLYGLEPGNDSNLNIAKMIAADDFSLGEFQLVETSEQAVLSQLRRFVRDEKWIVFPAWSPHPMNVEFEIEYLSGGDKYYGPNYGAAEVYTLTRKDYVQECSNAGRFFTNLSFTSEMESEVMRLIDEGIEIREAGKIYLTQNPEVLERWLEGVNTTTGEPGRQAVATAFELE